MRKLLLALVFSLPVVVLASDKGLWFDFKAYPGARLLCSEVIAGSRREHITWRTLATADKLAKVVAFYEKSEGAKAEQRDGAFHLSARADPERVKMSIYDVADVAKFPHCEQGAKKGERTVILVSEILSP